MIKQKSLDSLPGDSCLIWVDSKGVHDQGESRLIRSLLKMNGLSPVRSRVGSHGLILVNNGIFVIEELLDCGIVLRLDIHRSRGQLILTEDI